MHHTHTYNLRSNAVLCAHVSHIYTNAWLLSRECRTINIHLCTGIHHSIVYTIYNRLYTHAQTHAKTHYFANLHNVRGPLINFNFHGARANYNYTVLNQSWPNPRRNSFSELCVTLCTMIKGSETYTVVCLSQIVRYSYTKNSIIYKIYINI